MFSELLQDNASLPLESSDSQGLLLTPWFKLIVKHFLFPWWDKLDNVQSLADTDTIHRMS